MTTVKERMMKARSLIQAMEYEQARAILKTVDHPTAKQWLAKIDAITPEKPKRENPIASFLFAVFQFVFASLLAGIPLNLLYQEFTRANRQVGLSGMNSTQSIMMLVLFIILFGGGLIISRRLSQWLRGTA